MSTPIPVLFVDDDADVQKAARLLLPRHGFAPFSAHTPEEAWSVLASAPIRLVLLDLNFSTGATSGAEGLSLLRALLGHDSDLRVVVVTAHSGIRIAVEAMRAGAADFVMKPWNNERLIQTLRLASAPGRTSTTREAERETVADDGPLLGESPAIHQVRALAERLASSNAAMLLSGPAGSGKSMLARLLHRLSTRSDRTPVALDPAALWAEGDAALRRGFETVTAGDTLLLDGVDALPAPAQRHLLRMLDGLPDLRVISCSRSDEATLRNNGFQADLLARLCLLELSLPPLAARGGDAVLLARHFLRVFAARSGHTGLSLSEHAEEVIARRPWPDNVRELRQAVERAVLLTDSGVMVLAPQSFLSGILPHAPVVAAPTLRDTERELVEAALRRHGFNVSRAADELGLSRTALYRRMARHRL